MKVFSGSSNKPLAEKIAKHLGTKLSPVEIHIFPDGERRIRILDKVLDEDVVIVQTTSPSPDKHYMELFFLVDSAKRAGAKNITVVVPYLGYQRQDHLFREGEAVSLEVIAETLEATGINKLIVYDLHSIKIPENFSIPVVHLSALSIFAKRIKELFKDYKDAVLISPDMGGIRRIKILSEFLDGMPYVSIEKNRDLATGNIESSKFVTEDKDFTKKAKRAIIVDDMISTGRTIVAAVDLIIKSGIKESYVFATHPVFSNESKEILGSSGLSKVFVTDTIKIPDNKKFDKLEILTVSEEIAKSLQV